jgi:hypothetical protein
MSNEAGEGMKNSRKWPHSEKLSEFGLTFCYRVRIRNSFTTPSYTFRRTRFDRILLHFTSHVGLRLITQSSISVAHCTAASWHRIPHSSVASLTVRFVQTHGWVPVNYRCLSDCGAWQLPLPSERFFHMFKLVHLRFSWHYISTD